MKLKIVSIAFSLEVKKSFISESIILSLCCSILFGFCLQLKDAEYQYLYQINMLLFYSKSTCYLTCES